MKTAPGALILISLLFLFACKKESFVTSPDARITITADTVKYDTVFTTAGSVTQSFKIVNENDQKINISSIKLMGGNSSAYKINVDGFIGPEVNNLEIAANDSLYVFVSVVIDQGANNLPFVVQDSIHVNYNGRDRWVQLEAWVKMRISFATKKLQPVKTGRTIFPTLSLVTWS